MHLCTGLIAIINGSIEHIDPDAQAKFSESAIVSFIEHQKTESKSSTQVTEDRVALIHYSLQEYFDQHGREYFPDTHDTMSIVCTLNLRRWLSVRRKHTNPRPRRNESSSPDTKDSRSEGLENFAFGVKFGSIDKELGADHSIIFSNHDCQQLLDDLDMKSPDPDIPLLEYAFNEVCAHARLAPAAQFGVAELLATYPLIYCMGFYKHKESYWGREGLYPVRQGRFMELEAVKLHVAVMNRFDTAVAHLLKSGAHPDSVMLPSQGSLLHNSTETGHLTMLLLEHGADPNRANRLGRTALHVVAARHGEDQASRREQIAVGRALVSAGAKINAIDKDGRTPLMDAANVGAVSLMGYLIEEGASVKWLNEQTGGTGRASLHENNSALSFAWAGDHFQCMKVLLEAGADYRITSTAGKMVIPNPKMDHQIKEGSTRTIFSYVASPKSIKLCRKSTHQAFWVEHNRVCISLDANLEACKESPTWTGVSESDVRRAHTWT